MGMNELKKLKQEVIARIMTRHGYSREEAEMAWQQFKLQIASGRFLRPMKKEDVDRN